MERVLPTRVNAELQRFALAVQEKRLFGFSACSSSASAPFSKIHLIS
jgi:hypothetical protein